ncbi:Alpha/Beta hydrolase protein [Naematelia encephala]|uniref:Alpha/Beta hydrolase protein n=1 Tax=Naematelia encephala TaxID=71784 RepID=A0A1Y2B5Q3_9TREE|nr:Alpha/Beta hydrolase protein [Naematelia encephala]
MRGLRGPSPVRTLGTLSEQDQTMRLPGGRLLGFRPLIYLHGYPSSRIEAKPADDMAGRHGIRLLALDRPGFGLSTPQPNRTLLNYAEDVRHFAEVMHLDRFAIIGVSGGGPFAVACTHALPRRMLTGVGLFASGAPWAAGAHHMSWTRRILCWLSNHWPSALGLVIRASASFVKMIMSSGPGVRRLDAFLDKAGTKEEARRVKNGPLLRKESKEERREYLWKVLAGEPLRQGSDAAVLEARLLSAQDWGFKLEDVDFDPIRIWHGLDDDNSPIAAIRYLANQLPHSELHEFEGDTHYTMFRHLEGALQELLLEEKPKTVEGMDRP